MTRIAYVNGRYVSHRDAAVHIEDRGYQFADGVYEVCGIVGGRIVDEALHLDRLQRSLAELRIRMPVALPALKVVLREVVRRNRLGDGRIYLQVTRGRARRDHAFPAQGVDPSIVVTAAHSDRPRLERALADGVAVATMSDERWARRDIKSVSLLPNVLAKQAARERGAYEAWLVDGDGVITEGASTNAWIVDAEGTLRTHPLGPRILGGITRRVLTDVIVAEHISFAERPFTVAEAHAAREAFATASSAVLLPVVQIDDRPVGDGRPGPLGRRLRAAYDRFSIRTG